MVTIFRLKGTHIMVEIRPDQKDIVIWEGDKTLKIITGLSVIDRMRESHEWLYKKFKKYDPKKMIEIPQAEANDDRTRNQRVKDEIEEMEAKDIESAEDKIKWPSSDTEPNGH